MLASLLRHILQIVCFNSLHSITSAMSTSVLSHIYCHPHGIYNENGTCDCMYGWQGVRCREIVCEHGTATATLVKASEHDPSVSGPEHWVHGAACTCRMLWEGRHCEHWNFMLLLEGLVNSKMLLVALTVVVFGSGAWFIGVVMRRYQEQTAQGEDDREELAVHQLTHVFVDCAVQTESPRQHTVVRPKSSESPEPKSSKSAKSKSSQSPKSKSSQSPKSKSSESPKSKSSESPNSKSRESMKSRSSESLTNSKDNPLLMVTTGTGSLTSTTLASRSTTKERCDQWNEQRTPSECSHEIQFL